MRTGIFIVILVVELLSVRAEAQRDSVLPQHASRVSISAGFGGLYENFGGTLGLEYATHHFVVGARASGMVGDRSNSNSGGFLFSDVDLPTERVSEYALLAGYGIMGRRGFVEFLAGPSYSFGTLRGAYDSTDFRSSFWTTNYYERTDFREWGYTIEAKGALTDEDGTGGGLTLFLTDSPAVTYGGFMLDLIIGFEW